MVWFRQNISFVFILLFYLIVSGVMGVRWGLPSSKRSELVLPQEALSNATLLESYYEKLARARDKIYILADKNVAAYHWRLKVSGQLKESIDKLPTILRVRDSEIPEPILHSLSSYLVRSVDADEQNVFSAIAKMKPEKLDFNPHSFSYGGFFLYTIGGVLKLSSLCGYLILNPDIKFYYAHPDEMAKFYIVGRWVMVAAIVISAIMIYSFCVRYFDKKTGVMAAIFFLFSPIVTYYSYVTKPHFFSLPLSLLSLYYSYKISYQSNKKFYIYAGIFGGLAMGAAINNLWLVGTGILVGHILFDIKNPSPAQNRLKNWMKVGVAFTIMVAIFLMTNPYIIISRREFIDEYKWISVFNKPLWNLELIRNVFLVVLPLGLGYSVLVGSIGAIFSWISKRIVAHPYIFLMSYVVTAGCISILLASPHTRYPHFMRLMPPVGVGIIVASAVFLSDILYRARKSIGIILVSLVMLMHVLQYSTYFLNLYAESYSESNAIKAGKWINENIKSTTNNSIGITAPSPHVDRVPPFRFTDYEIRTFTYVKELPDKKYLPLYFIVGENPGDLPTIYSDYIRWKNFHEHYELIRYFPRSSGVVGSKFFADYISPINYAVRIYKRIS